MSRLIRLLLLFGAFLSAGALAVRAAEPSAPRRPNILFILADDLGYGDLGSYGQKEIRTPVLDRLAAEGTRFTDFYAGCTVCAPSRCALMTGFHTGHAVIRGNRSPEIALRPEDRSLGEVLKAAGYATAIIGKWGVGPEGSTGTPLKKGFDHFFGYYTQQQAHNYYPARIWRDEQPYPLRNLVEKGVSSNKLDYVPDLCTADALRFIDAHQREPFFLYLPYTLPHANNEARGQGMEVPSDAPYSDRPWPQPQKNQAAMITRLDGYVGQVLQRLRERGLERNTLVLFSSDNGPHHEGGGDPEFFHSRGPLRGIKRDLYEGGIRVPLLAKWPGHVPAGAASAAPWTFWDVLPTLAEVAGAAAPPGIDGVSMVPGLVARGAADRKRAPHPPLYWEFHERGFDQAVRMGDWKYLRMQRPAGTRVELYNLREDLGETRDVAREQPEVIARMEAFLKTARTDSPYWPVPRE